MKLLIAYIQQEKLNAVKQALFKKEIYKLSVTNALGCGQQMGYTEIYRGSDIEVNLLKKIRIEVAINKDFLDAAIEGITEGARSGNIGDGLDLTVVLYYQPTQGKYHTFSSRRLLLHVLVLWVRWQVHGLFIENLT